MLEDIKPPSAVIQVLLEDARATEDWTKDIPLKFPDLPKAIKAHLEVTAELLGRVCSTLAFLNKPVVVEKKQPEDKLPPIVDIHAVMVSNGIRLAKNHKDLAHSVGFAEGAIAGMFLGKLINERHEKMLTDRFRKEFHVRREALGPDPSDDPVRH